MGEASGASLSAITAITSNYWNFGDRLGSSHSCSCDRQTSDNNHFLGQAQTQTQYSTPTALPWIQCKMGKDGKLAKWSYTTLGIEPRAIVVTIIVSVGLVLF